ncbi:hypothetical protein FSP39_001761 [Pinctada imbricata]|uniref:BZIP domain-containing protein n=1 Tax=Pinctada imbricata TaxID=66713 RepID=A0AA89BYG7_PINIB|nr:hypothetical protein FSP39_001761 [Pinctada imbricata]
MQVQAYYPMLHSNQEDWSYNCYSQYDYYSAYSFIFPSEHQQQHYCNKFNHHSNMQRRDRNTAPRERLSSSGSSIGELSEDESIAGESVGGECQLNTEDVSDPRLLQAASAAVQEQRMMPLIKEELRLSILHRRTQQGLGDIKFEEKKPIPKRPLTPKEKERKLRRQEQNRRAAKKCRRKKKDQEESLLTAYNAEQAKRAELEKQVSDLRQEKLKLDNLLKEHMHVCSIGTAYLTNIQAQNTLPSSTITSEDASSNTNNANMVSIPYLDAIPTGQLNPVFDTNGSEVISPGPSEPFTPGLDAENRNYFMYPDTAYMADEKCSVQDITQTEGNCAGDVGLADLDDCENVVDIQDFLDGFDNHNPPDYVTATTGQLQDGVNPQAQIYPPSFHSPVYPSGSIEQDSGNFDASFLSSLTGFASNGSSFPELFDTQWSSLPFSDLSDPTTNRH